MSGIIKITNSCIYTNEVNGSFISTENNVNEHGFGLSNIKKTVKKYDGFIQFKFNSDSQKFVTTIIFKSNAIFFVINFPTYHYSY